MAFALNGPFYCLALVGIEITGDIHRVASRTSSNPSHVYVVNALHQIEDQTLSLWANTLKSHPVASKSHQWLTLPSRKSRFSATKL